MSKQSTEIRPTPALSFRQNLGRSRFQRYLRLPQRLSFSWHYFSGTAAGYLNWLLSSNENYNFSYHLDELNRRYLTAFISHISGCSYQQIDDYMTEFIRDKQLLNHYRQVLKSSPHRHLADPEPRFARRIGWYALIRAIKPKVVIETGVDRGLGSCVISAALLKNQSENEPGRYYGTDIDPNAGMFYQEPYTSVGEILYGDSIESLKKFSQPIDLFINDSDHSGEYEFREYQVIESKLSPNGIILGDNSHATDSLLRYALESGREFLFFQEKPTKHWYPGAGIGASLKKKTPQ